jgi:hypothetical protein
MSDPSYIASIDRLTAVNFWQTAKIVSASLETKSDRSPAKVTAIPFYFRASHAAELLLKSALLKRGFQEGDLKKVGLKEALISDDRHTARVERSAKAAWFQARPCQAARREVTRMIAAAAR